MSRHVFFFYCSLLDKPPYVCTRCPKEKSCKCNHAYYTAHRAHAKYVKELSSARKGIRTSPEGHSYADFKSFMEQNPKLPIVEMDTVRGAFEAGIT
jgi:hypothetical protein